MLPRLRHAPSSVPLSRARGRAGEGGYNMVMLIVAIAVLNIVVAAMLPLMSTEIQREKEEELVFRGFQYAEAIRIFRARYQRYPNKLAELLEVKPRCIRQLWKDPMTKDGKWGLIPPGGGVPLNPQQTGQGGAGSQPVNPGDGQTSDPEGAGQADAGNGLDTPKKGDVVTVGPIAGVYSKSTKTAHLIFYGHEHYNEWRFTDDLLPGGGSGLGGGGGARQPPSIIPGVRDPGAAAPIPNFSIRWLGRPMHFVDQASQPQNGTLPGAGSPGSPAGKGNGARRPAPGGTIGSPQN